jgi:hypothetical protein
MILTNLFSYQLNISPLWVKDIIIAILGGALAISLTLANQKGESLLIKFAMILPIVTAIHDLEHVNYISFASTFDVIVISACISLVLDYVTTKAERPDLKYRFINLYVLLTLYAIIKYQTDVLKFMLNSVLMAVVFVIITFFPPIIML